MSQVQGAGALRPRLVAVRSLPVFGDGPDDPEVRIAVEMPDSSIVSVEIAELPL